MTVANWFVMLPGITLLIPSGNFARKGTRAPPSVVYALYSLLGAVAACAHLGP
jgi:hypothetical protein